MNALPNVRPSGDEMFVGECGDGNAGEKSGRDRTREVVYKLGVHVYAIISQPGWNIFREIHVRDEFVKFCDSLVQATCRTREMPEVMPDNFRGFSKPERELQKDDV